MALTFEEFRNSEKSRKPHFLVIGHPISHSLSPVMHNRSIRHYGLDAEYLAVNLFPSELSSFITWCYRDEFKGCNITIPYKEMLLEMLDEIDASVKQIGAINTILKKNNRLIGYNTDQYGFTEPLMPFLNKIDTGRAIIFGTGGASKAVKAALEEIGFEELVFVSRRADKEIESESSEIFVIDYSQWQAFAPETNLFINTTPLGMYPELNNSPVAGTDIHLLSESLCYDLIYNPQKTLFLSDAETQGAKIINGLEMLIYQGSKSFELWTGQPFPIDKVKAELNRHIQ